MEIQITWPRIAKTIAKEEIAKVELQKKKVTGLILPDFKIYYKGLIKRQSGVRIMTDKYINGI